MHDQYEHMSCMGGIGWEQFHFSNEMRRVWMEHVLWTRLFVISAIDGLADKEQTAARLLENPQDIADLFRNYYGDDAANLIETLLTEHLDIAADLVNALKSGDFAKAEEMDEKWYDNADQMAKAFASINPYFGFEEMQQMLYEHLNATKEEIAARLAKDYAKDVQSFDKIENQALEMADAFVQGIVRQFPEEFLKAGKR